jgi:hypothetical protein
MIKIILLTYIRYYYKANATKDRINRTPNLKINTSLIAVLILGPHEEHRGVATFCVID